jgi:hypothetical protein
MTDQTQGADSALTVPPTPMRVPSMDEIWQGFAAARAAVVEVLSGLAEMGAKAAVWLDANQDEIYSFLQSSSGRSHTDWGYLLGLPTASTGMMISFTLEAAARYRPEFADAVEEILERELLDAEVVDEVRSAIARSQLSSTQKRQLGRALDDLAARDYEMAVPMLMNPLEGAYWMLAERRGAIVRDRKGKWVTPERPDRPAVPIDGVEKAMKLEQVGLPPKLLQFLTRRAYGGGGNPFRHGTATSGWRSRALFLFGALLGWLDAVGELKAQHVVRRAGLHRDERENPPAIRQAK